MRRIGVGVIGGGYFGEVHTHVLSGLPNVDLVAVCSRRKERARNLASKYGARKWFVDKHQLVKDEEIEAVHIVTAEDHHREPTVEAAEAGKHILVEKPIATTLNDADEMISATEKADVILMVGHELRFDPRYAMAKEQIRSGKIGKILSIYARRNLSRSLPRLDRVLDRVSSIVDDALHDIDQMLWYTEDRVERVYAEAVNVRGRANPDLGWSLFRFRKGTIGVCESAWILPDTTPFGIDARMEILGSEGAIYIDVSNQGLNVNDKEGWKALDTYHWPVLHGSRTGTLKEEISYFVDSVMRGEKPKVITPEEARVNLEVVLAADRSARTKEVVQLPLK